MALHWPKSRSFVLGALAAMQEEPMASMAAPEADLGTYQLYSLANAFAFDHYCHLRVDLLAPTGPIVRDLPPVDDALVAPAVGWMLIRRPAPAPSPPWP